MRRLRAGHLALESLEREGLATAEDMLPEILERMRDQPLTVRYVRESLEIRG